MKKGKKLKNVDPNTTQIKGLTLTFDTSEYINKFIDFAINLDWSRNQALENIMIYFFDEGLDKKVYKEIALNLEK